MISLGAFGSILLGMAIIIGLIKHKQIGCMGYVLVLLLALILLGALFMMFIITVGGDML